MKKTIFVIKFALKILLGLVLSCIIPRNKKYVVIGGGAGKRFTDNSRYFYLKLFEEKVEYQLDKVIWLTDNNKIKKDLNFNGYEAYLKNSLKGIWYACRSFYHIVDQNGNVDLVPYLSYRAKKINLWHGFPLKKIEIQKKSKIHYFLKKKLSLGGWDNSYFLACTKLFEETLIESFKLKKNQIIKGSYPRLNYLVDNIEYKNFKEYNEVEKIKKIKGEKKIITYLPTFRDSSKTKIFGIESNKELKKFIEWLSDNGYFLILKLHPAESRLFNREKINMTNENFLNLSSDFDIYPFLKETDILIVDYSSVYFDFLALNKEIIFFTYDLDSYLEERGLLFDYDKMTPGEKIHSIEELKWNLKKNGGNRKDIYSDERKKIFNRIFSNYTLNETINNILNI